MSDDLLGYLFDTLDLEEQKAIEERLEREPALRAELERLRQLTCPLATDDIIEPPLGLAARTVEAIQRGEPIQPIPLTASIPTTREWPESAPRMRAVDFVVAASVLGIAAMLVFPAIASLRGDQARILCTEQLRKVGVALAMYAQQESEQLPFVAPSGPTNNAGIFALSLKARELVTDPRTFLCPAAANGIVLLPEPLKYLSDNSAFDRERIRMYMSGSYGYMLGYHANGIHQGFARASDNHPVVADRPPRSDEVHFVNSPNHQDTGQNVLYADGSVRWLPSRIVVYDDIFRNRNCEVAAGVDASDVVIGASEATPYPNIQL